jgi:hypothetical protein
MEAAISLSARGLPRGVPNKSSAVSMWSEVGIAAMIPIQQSHQVFFSPRNEILKKSRHH